MPRVIAGSARGRRLKSVPGDTTRPILDRVKENLFNIIGLAVRDSRWLDLFAGTGQVGIEALSRGAAYCLFTELDRSAVRVIAENLAITRLEERGEVRRTDALAMLRSASIGEAFDFVFVAPPQYRTLWHDALVLIDTRPEWLYPDGTVIVQVDPRETMETQFEHLVLYDQRTYGNTLLMFYERPGD